MRCETHCPRDGSALAAPLQALGAAVVLAVVGWAVEALAPLWMAMVAAEVVVAVAGVWAVQRRVRYWGWRKPADKRALNPVTVTAELVRAPYQIPAPPLAIEAPRAVPAALARDGAKVEA